MTPAEVDRDVRARLRALGVSVPDPPAAANAEVARFQQENGLVPNGRPTFETYAALAGARLPPGASVSSGPAAPPPPAPVDARQAAPGMGEGRPGDAS